MSWAEHFDTVAEGYDEFTSTSGWLTNNVLVELLDREGVAAQSILDVGAGTGQTATALRSLYPRADLVLAEPSVEMARRAVAAHPGAAMMIVEADDLLGTVDPVLGPAAYDLVTCIGVLELLPDAPATIGRAAANLAEDGHLAVTYELLRDGSPVQGERVSDLSGGRRVTRYRPESLRAAGDRAGLHLVAAETFAAYQRGDSREDVVNELLLWRRS
jgi:predicted TPR repeat methyltransferase